MISVMSFWLGRTGEIASDLAWIWFPLLVFFLAVKLLERIQFMANQRKQDQRNEEE